MLTLLGQTEFYLTPHTFHLTTHNSFLRLSAETTELDAGPEVPAVSDLSFRCESVVTEVKT